MKDGLFLAHRMEILLPSFFQLDDVRWPSFVEVLEEGIVSSGLGHEFLEVVVLGVEHGRSFFQLARPIDCPLLQTTQLLKLSQLLQQLSFLLFKCCYLLIFRLVLRLYFLLIVHDILHHEFERLLPLQKILFPELYVLQRCLTFLVRRLDPFL